MYSGYSIPLWCTCNYTFLKQISLSLSLSLSLQVSGRYQEQLLAVNLLREELEQTQHHYDVERQRYAKIRAQMKIKERIRRDLGGLTDTVVSGV